MVVTVDMFVHEGLGRSPDLIDLGNGSAAIVDRPRSVLDSGPDTRSAATGQSSAVGR